MTSLITLVIRLVLTHNVKIGSLRSKHTIETLKRNQNTIQKVDDLHSSNRLSTAHSRYRWIGRQTFKRTDIELYSALLLIGGLATLS